MRLASSSPPPATVLVSLVPLVLTPTPRVPPVVPLVLLAKTLALVLWFVTRVSLVAMSSVAAPVLNALLASTRALLVPMNVPRVPSVLTLAPLVGRHVTSVRRPPPSVLASVPPRLSSCKKSD